MVSFFISQGGLSMNDDTAFDYYYGDESEQFAFYRIPRKLVTGERFKKLSTDAKLLYGLLLDRMGLSAKNGWYDEQGRVYIFYTLSEIQEDMDCGHEKAVKLLAELDTKGIGLIERIKQGQGRPTRIYVKRFTTRAIPPKPAAPQEVPRLPIYGSQDFGKSEVKSSEKPKCRLPDFGSADFGKSDASYIKSNQTDFSQLNPSIHPSPKITFSLREFLSHKVLYKDIPISINLSRVQTITDNNTQKVAPFGGGGIDYMSIKEQYITALIPDEPMQEFSVDGINSTGIGYIDGQLHIQTEISDYLNNDNHGFFYLKDEADNIINCSYNYYFSNDGGQSGAIYYCEYVYNVSQDEIGKYSR